MQQRDKIQTITRIGLSNLCIAIIEQAAKDYQKALCGEKVSGKPAKVVIEDVELFFHSAWYNMMTEIDPDYILKRIREDVRNDNSKLIRISKE